jgi:hypothetical protein
MILLNNHRYALITGIVLAVILAFLMGGSHFYELGLARWFHIVSGVFWIGLLYYSTSPRPGVGDAAADKGGPAAPASPNTWHPGAVCSAGRRWRPDRGAWLLIRAGTFVNAFTLGEGSQVIGVGAWLGTIMLLNVWGVIWPNQKKILGIKPASDEEKARARKTAGLASRVNFVLSIPMLMCMAGQSHGLPFMK